MGGGVRSDSCVRKIHHLLRCVFSANVLVSCLQFFLLFFFNISLSLACAAAVLVIHYITSACELGEVYVVVCGGGERLCEKLEMFNKRKKKAAA